MAEHVVVYKNQWPARWQFRHSMDRRPSGSFWCVGMDGKVRHFLNPSDLKYGPTRITMELVIPCNFTPDWEEDPDQLRVGLYAALKVRIQDLVDRGARYILIDVFGRVEVVPLSKSEAAVMVTVALAGFDKPLDVPNLQTSEPIPLDHLDQVVWPEVIFTNG